MRRQLRSVAIASLVGTFFGGCVKVTAVPMSASVAISSQGECSVLSQVVACHDVGATLVKAHAPSDCDILIYPDVHAPYEPVAEAVASMKQEHFSNFSFAASTRTANGDT